MSEEARKLVTEAYTKESSNISLRNNDGSYVCFHLSFYLIHNPTTGDCSRYKTFNGACRAVDKELGNVSRKQDFEVSKWR